MVFVAKKQQQSLVKYEYKVFYQYATKIISSFLVGMYQILFSCSDAEMGLDDFFGVDL